MAARALLCLLLALTCAAASAAAVAQEASSTGSLVRVVALSVERALLSASRSRQAQAEAPGPAKVSAWSVFFFTTAVAFATGLGALPFFFFGRLSSTWEGIANSLACGVMLAASFDLIHEGHPYGPGSVVLGVLLGTLFIRAAHSRLQQCGDIEFSHLRGGGARKTLLMLAIMTAHAFGEGAGMGVAFAGRTGWTEGMAVTAAIGVHNVPEGLAVATVLISSGASPLNAAAWAIFTHLPQAVVAVPAFLFVETFQQLLPGALGFAAGCMLWMVFAELLPDATKALPAEHVATAATLAAATLEALRMALAGLAGEGGGWAEAGPTALRPALVEESMLLAGAKLAFCSFAACPLGGAAAVAALAAAPGSGSCALAPALGAAAGLGAATLACQLLGAGAGAAAVLAAAMGATAAWALRSRALSPPHKAHDEESDLPLHSAAPNALCSSVSAAVEVSAASRGVMLLSFALAAHAAAHGLSLGAASRAAAMRGVPLTPLTLRASAEGAVRGAVGAGAFTGLTRQAPGAVSVAAAVGAVHFGATVLALAGPAWAGVSAELSPLVNSAAAGMLLCASLLEYGFWHGGRRPHRPAASEAAIAAAAAAFTLAAAARCL